MLDRSHTVRFLFLIALSLIGTGSLGAQSPVVRIGIVQDGPWERNDEIRVAFENEISNLLGRAFDVSFPAEKRIEADWSADGIREGIDRLLSDPEVDILLALGPRSSNNVARRGTLPKPALAAFVIDAELQGIPIRFDPELGRPISGVANLSYVVVGTDVQRELRFFREIVPFKKLTFLTSLGLSEAIPELEDRLTGALAGLDVEHSVVAVRRSASEALQAIPADTEAVYVAPLLQLGPGEFELLVDGLIERRIPSFSMWGRSEVERGLLSALGLDLDYLRIARRIALNVQRILLGEDPSEFPVDFERGERLTINMSTARAIGFFPSWGMITEAELLNEEDRTDAGRQVSLASAAHEAVFANRDLAAAERIITGGLERIRRARSDLFPRIGVGSSGSVIDKDRAQAGFGSVGRQTYAGSIGVSQVIYSEQVRAGLDIERHLQVSREQERDGLRLDVIRDAAVAYLNVLASKTVERVRKDNLRLTRTNLELARSRQRLGAASAAEVYRWENQIANNRREVIDASAVRNQAEMVLNRILHRPLEESFSTAEATLDDPEIISSFQRLSPYINNYGLFDVFRDFMVQEAFDASPELKRLDAAIAAQRRALLATERSFYLPELSAQAEISTFTQIGSSALPSFPGLAIPGIGNVNWNLGFGASLPLYTGGGRRAERGQAEEELARLLLDRESVQERVEQRTRSTLHSAMASWAGIELSQDAADAARNNLDLVADAYAQGVLDILDLLDAQNAALVAELVAANSIHSFLIDLMEVERAVGRFDFFVASEQEREFLGRLNSFYEAAGYPVTPR